MTVAQAKNGVVVSVRDEGIGVSPEARQRIFDLFYTTKDGGSGLGLPLSRQIMVAHRGSIRCESEPGQGTTFELWFPAGEAPAVGSPLAIPAE